MSSVGLSTLIPLLRHGGAGPVGMAVHLFGCIFAPEFSQNRFAVSYNATALAGDRAIKLVSSA